MHKYTYKTHQFTVHYFNGDNLIEVVKNKLAAEELLKDGSKDTSKLASSSLKPAVDSSKKDTDFKIKITLPDGLSMTEFIKKISHPLVEQTNQKNDHDSTNSTASITPPNSPFRNDEEEFKTDDAQIQYNSMNGRE